MLDSVVLLSFFKPLNVTSRLFYAIRHGFVLIRFFFLQQHAFSDWRTLLFCTRTCLLAILTRARPIRNRQRRERFWHIIAIVSKIQKNLVCFMEPKKKKKKKIFKSCKIQMEFWMAVSWGSVWWFGASPPWLKHWLHHRRLQLWQYYIQHSMLPPLLRREVLLQEAR